MEFLHQCFTWLASVQEVANRPKTDLGGPAVATTARGIREGIVKGRMVFQMFFTLTRFSKMALNYFATRSKTAKK